MMKCGDYIPLTKKLYSLYKEQLQKVSDRQRDLTDLLERRAFAKGFRLAVKLMADVMNTMGVPSVDG